MRPKISLLTFTLNEEANIKELIENVKGLVDEIVVIDSYSEDKTAVIAKTYGAKVYLAPRLGYADPLRNVGVKKASNRWIIWLDADERLSVKAKHHLRELLMRAEKEGLVAVSLPVYLVASKGHCMKPTWQPRIFRKDRVLFKGVVHELPEIKGPIMLAPDDMLILNKGPLRGSAATLRRAKKYLMLELWQFRPVLRKGNLELQLPRALRLLALLPYPFVKFILDAYQNFKTRLPKGTSLLDFLSFIDRWFYYTNAFYIAALRAPRYEAIADIVRRHGVGPVLRVREGDIKELGTP